MAGVETYFDFDAETFQITEKKRLSSSSGTSGDVLTPNLSSPYKSTCSEDTGFETSSDRSSQDGVIESPRSPSQDFSCLTCPRGSFDSLVARPVRRYDSKESIKSTSSFWDSNVPPETKAVLSKIRDQMRSSLEKVRKLEEEAKQIPLLQVKISILQEEKRQLVAQLENRLNLKKSRSRSSTMSSNTSRSSSIDDLIGGSQDRKTRNIGVGDDTIHDILCEKCNEIQSKLLGHSLGAAVGYCSEVPRTVEGRRGKSRTIQDDDIKVFQDRCTQTKTFKYESTSVQATVSTNDVSTEINTRDNSGIMIKRTDVTTKDSSSGPSLFETRSIGVGKMNYCLKDSCAGEDREIPSYTNTSVQNTVFTCDKSCGVQIITDSIGVIACPTVISVATQCSSIENRSNKKQHSIGIQTAQEDVDLVSVGVGMSSIDDSEDCECSKCNSPKSLCEDEILQSNNSSIAVETSPWVDVEGQLLLEYYTSKSLSSVAVETSITSRSVGCGDQSITDVSCQNCVLKISRSLGVNCSPKMSDKAVGDGDGDVDVVPRTSSVGVGECCLTDSYCERCFSLQTRTVGVGNGSVLDTVQTDLETPILTDVSLQPLSPPQTPNLEEKLTTGLNENVSPIQRMFSDEYERVESDELILDFTSEKTCKASQKSTREDILFTCKLLQRHFQSNTENLDEENLLLCIKNIEDYWFTCVTDERLDNESLTDLIRVFQQHLPYLLDGIINSQDEHTNQCNVIITNKAGYSAVMLASLKEAVNSKDKVVLKRLFEKGNLNCVAQSTGQTALMLAAGMGNVETVDLLLQCGATKTINTADLDGSTALMCACEHGYAKVVKKLLEVDGCDASIADHDGSTSFSIAMEHNRKDIALMIYSHIEVYNSTTSHQLMKI
ncbi:KN motif and ankyrin repeat domain-containing protein 1-like [Dendronephthya gigantea]|uniref:KN motif and ankyrin repeat domain-containing protein 1-like n=1 Tax=Dendronephthya gigantea TaxID=151771 RepID=UPI0010698098|nr:KN motif and ankyrin repeat domain-containing protein 1-like [Dendronephthya gigantea]